MRGDGEYRGAESPLVPRRVLLAASGAVLLTSTVAAMAGKHDSSAPGVVGSATSPPTRHAELTRHAARPPRPEQPGLVYGEPMYTVDDGPKVVALTIDDGPSPVY